MQISDMQGSRAAFLNGSSWIITNEQILFCPKEQKQIKAAFIFQASERGLAIDNRTAVFKHVTELQAQG